MFKGHFKKGELLSNPAISADAKNTHLKVVSLIPTMGKKYYTPA